MYSYKDVFIRVTDTFNFTSDNFKDISPKVIEFDQEIPIILNQWKCDGINVHVTACMVAAKHWKVIMC